jgi:hypothetical protein
MHKLLRPHVFFLSLKLASSPIRLQAYIGKASTCDTETRKTKRRERYPKTAVLADRDDGEGGNQF